MSQRPPSPKVLLLRVAALVLVLGGGFFLAVKMGWVGDLDAEGVRTLVQSAGAWGVVLYLVLFALGELVHIPGMVFVAAALLLWGPWAGAAVGWLGCVVSVVVTFVVVRSVGGQALTAIDKPWMTKALAWLGKAPIRTIIALRLVMWVAPPLNYLLALSGVKFRDFVIGSAVGLLAPVAFIAYAADWIFN
ncbi:MAG: VTT domain-containing protein [Myxococcales bacterium]|nr:VTT domain-containing protein [Myxococcales bacterium]